jgi:hypothetical protein
MLADPFHRTSTVGLKVLDLVVQVLQAVQVQENTAHRDLHKSVNHWFGC